MSRQAWRPVCGACIPVNVFREGVRRAADTRGSRDHEQGAMHCAGGGDDGASGRCRFHEERGLARARGTRTGAAGPAAGPAAPQTGPHRPGVRGRSQMCVTGVPALPVEGGAAQVAELLLSELVTNALIHTPHGAAVTVSMAPARLRVEVRDFMSGLPLSYVPAADDGTHGRGCSWCGASRTPGASALTRWARSSGSNWTAKDPDRVSKPVPGQRKALTDRKGPGRQGLAGFSRTAAPDLSASAPANRAGAAPGCRPRR